MSRFLRRRLMPLLPALKIKVEDGHSNDYVYYHMKKEDGRFIHVLDHGRIVENGRYGKVFYVLIMDFDSMNRNFKDPFL